MNNRITQCDRIKAYLERFGSITQLEALQDIGIMRLASRISEMRRDGYEIESDFVTKKNRYGEKCSFKRYYIKGENKK